MLPAGAGPAVTPGREKVEERIGESLVRIGAMTPEQVEQVLSLQKDGDRRLFGEIAIEQGFINDKAIKDYLDARK